MVTFNEIKYAFDIWGKKRGRSSTDKAMLIISMTIYQELNLENDQRWKYMLATEQKIIVDDRIEGYYVKDITKDSI